jgi:hypothetical protein
MDYSNEQDHHDSMEMNRHRLAPPSPDLQERVLRSAHEAWTSTDVASAEFSWGFPVLRLAASLALAMILISFANYADKRSLAKWQPVVHADAVTSNTLISWNRPGLNRLIAAAASMPERNAAQHIRRHTREIRKSLSTTEGRNE